MDKRKQKKLEKRLGLSLNEEQKKDILKSEDLDLMDFEFVTIPESERKESDKKFDIKITSDSDFRFNLTAKIFKKILKFSIKRKNKDGEKK